MPGDEEWDAAIKMASRFANRYRDLAPPPSASGFVEKKNSKITVKMIDPAWIPYFFAKALWRYEPGFRQRFGGPEDDKPSIAEEEFALAALVGGYLNAQESKDQKKEPDPYLDAIKAVFADRVQTGFILFEILHKTYGVSLECLPSAQADMLRQYFFSYALERVKAGDQ